MIHTYQREFIDFVIARGALRFGTFTLKSGRISPYFFNAGLFNAGKDIARLGQFYAQAILAHGIEFDVIFGPAYKGIPLATATVIALSENHGRDVPYAFNRKEIKDHGEGGTIVGHPLQGKVLIIDDVISSGLSITESIQLIKHAHAHPAGVVIALDRQERSQASTAAAMEIETQYGVPVLSIIKLDTLIAYLKEQQDVDSHLHAIQQYRATYGIESGGI